MKILLLGREGQLGRALAGRLQSAGELTAWGRAELDFSDLQALRSKLKQLRPQLIVNAVAYTAVDRAQSEPALCHAINATAPAALAEIAQQIGAWLIHYSTDYVFDGGGTMPWRETDVTGPVNIYGMSKAQGEEWVRTRCERHLIFRTSWVYAAWGQNFLRSVVRLAAERESLAMVSDQIGVPTSVALITEITMKALVALDQPDCAGTYHLAPTGETNWYDYTQRILSNLHAIGVPTKLSAPNVRPILSAQYPTPARRPLNSRLNTSKLRERFAIALPSWERDVQNALHALAPTLPR